MITEKSNIGYGIGKVHYRTFFHKFAIDFISIFKMYVLKLIYFYIYFN